MDSDEQISHEDDNGLSKLWIMDDFTCDFIGKKEDKKKRESSPA